MKELIKYFMTRKRYWLLPSMITLITLGLLIVLTSGSALSTFVYTVF